MPERAGRGSTDLAGHACDGMPAGAMKHCALAQFHTVVLLTASPLACFCSQQVCVRQFRVRTILPGLKDDDGVNFSLLSVRGA